MRNPRDFFKPLAIGAPEPLARDPVHAVADDPLLRLLATRRWSPRLPDIAPQGRHPARQPRGRDPGRPQGGRARRAWSGSAARSTSAQTPLWTRVNSLESPWVLDDLTQLVTEIGDRLDVIMVPKVEGAVGHPLRRPAAGPARGARRARAADPRPRDPRDRAGRGQRRGDRRRLAAHAGHELRPGRPRRLAADEDHARRRRPPRLPRARRPDPDDADAPRAERPAGPLALLDRAHGRRLRGGRDPPVLRPVRRHQATSRAARRSSAPRS